VRRTEPLAKMVDSSVSCRRSAALVEPTSIVAVASVTGRLRLDVDGDPADTDPGGAPLEGAPLANEKAVNASSVTVPDRVVSDSSPITGLLAEAVWESNRLAAATHRAATETAAVWANMPYAWPTHWRICGDEIT